MSTGSEAFSLFICLNASKFVLLSFFSLIKTIYPRVWTKPLPNDAKSPLPVDVRRSKTLLLKLPTIKSNTRSPFRITGHLALFAINGETERYFNIEHEEFFILSSRKIFTRKLFVHTGSQNTRQLSSAALPTCWTRGREAKGPRTTSDVWESGYLQTCMFLFVDYVI